MFLKIFDSEFSYIEEWFSDKNSKPLKIEDKINITLVINESIIYIKNDTLSTSTKTFVKGYGFLYFAKNLAKNN